MEFDNPSFSNTPKRANGFRFQGNISVFFIRGPTFSSRLNLTASAFPRFAGSFNPIGAMVYGP
jgi:hypothetical protein